MAALETLQDDLTKLLAGRPRQLGWGEPQRMSEALERVRQSFGGRRAMVREQRMARGVMAFRLLGQATDFVNLRYACQGLAQPMDWESRRLLGDRHQVEALLQRVEALRGDMRRFIACYRGLIISWQRAGELDDMELLANRALLGRFLKIHNALLPPTRRPALPPGLN